jgi:hypothetical protein
VIAWSDTSQIQRPALGNRIAVSPTKLRYFLQYTDLLIQEGKRLFEKLLMPRVPNHFELLQNMLPAQLQVILPTGARHLGRGASRVRGRRGTAVLRLLFFYAFAFPSPGHAPL